MWLLQQHPATATPDLNPQLYVRLLLHSERLLQHHARLLLLLHPETATSTPTPKLVVRLLRHPMRQHQQHPLTATQSPTPSCLCG